LVVCGILFGYVLHENKSKVDVHNEQTVRNPEHEQWYDYEVTKYSTKEPVLVGVVTHYPWNNSHQDEKSQYPNVVEDPLLLVFDTIPPKPLHPDYVLT